MRERMMKTLFTMMVAAAGLLVFAGDAQAQWQGMSEQQLQEDAQRRRGDARCGDFWVSYAFSRLTAGGIASGETCNVRNYNNGRWSSLTELIGLVDCYSRRGFPCGDLELHQYVTPSGANVRVVSVVNGKGIGEMTFGPDGRMVAAGGGNIYNTNGGNMVAAGGGNMVAAGGGNMVAAGGGNLIGNDAGSILPASTARLLSDLRPPANMQANGYRLQSAGQWVGLGTVRGPSVRGNDKVVNIADKLKIIEVPVMPKKDGGH